MILAACFCPLHSLNRIVGECLWNVVGLVGLSWVELIYLYRLGREGATILVYCIDGL